MTTRTIPTLGMVIQSAERLVNGRVTRYLSDGVEDTINMRIVEATSSRVDDRVGDFVFMHLRDRIRNG